MNRVFVPAHNMYATVVWEGNLPGLESLRYGIEFDSIMESSSDGVYQGIAYFIPRRMGCSKFVKKSFLAFSLNRAIRERYVLPMPLVPPPVLAKGMVPVLAGEEEATKFIQSSLNDRTEICLDNANIGYLDELDLKFPNLKRISLRGNQISDFDFIIKLATMIPSLEEIDASKNRMVFPKMLTICSSIKILKLNETYLSWSVLSHLDIIFPNLEELEFSNNRFDVSVGSMLGRVKSVSVSNCGLEFWPNEFAPNMTTLNISNNFLNFEKCVWSSSLVSLNISNCGIVSWDWLGPLMNRELSDLRVSSNPVYDNTLGARQIITALCPSLVLLNGATVTGKHRIEAEKYCRMRLERFPKDIVALFGTSLDQVERVCDEESNKETPVATVKRGSLMKLSVSDGSKRVEFRVPQSCLVSDLSTIVAKKLQWPFKLSQLGLSVSPPDGGFEDRIVLDVRNTELGDFGLESGWCVYANLIDGN